VDRVVVAVVLAAAAVVVALVLNRRRPDAPTQPRLYAVPGQLDRSDFDRPDAPWLVAVFTSTGCESCAGAVQRAAPLAGDQVCVQEVEVAARPELHERYAIDAVPTVVVADGEGVVRASFVGPPPAAELWAAVAEVRDRGD
jgi:protein-disulfide isomerase